MEEHNVTIPRKYRRKGHGEVIIKYPRTEPLHVTVNGKKLYRHDYKTEEAWRQAASNQSQVKSVDFAKLEEAILASTPVGELNKTIARKRSPRTPDEKAFDMAEDYGVAIDGAEYRINCLRESEKA